VLVRVVLVLYRLCNMVGSCKGCCLFGRSAGQKHAACVNLTVHVKDTYAALALHSCCLTVER